MIRRAERADADRVLALLSGLGRPPVATDPRPQEEIFAAHLRDEACAMFVAQAGDVLVGVASLWFRPRLNWTTPEAWLPDLFVEPGFRGRGVGRALLDVCVDAARERGCHRLVLESGHERTDAHRLYEAYGFVHGGRAYSLTVD